MGYIYYNIFLLVDLVFVLPQNIVVSGNSPAVQNRTTNNLACEGGLEMVVRAPMVPQIPTKKQLV